MSSWPFRKPVRMAPVMQAAQKAYFEKIIEVTHGLDNI